MRSLVVLRLALLALLAALCGCGTHTTIVPGVAIRPNPYPSNVLATLAPDSVADGQAITVKMYVVYGGCETFEGVDVTFRADSMLVVPLTRDNSQPGHDCPDILWEAEKDCIVIPPHAGAWRIVVAGGNAAGAGPAPFVLPVTVGAAPAPLRRYDVRVADRATGAPIAGASVTLVRGDWSTANPDTFATLATDAQGRASLAAGGAGSDSTYFMRVDHAGYAPQTYQWSPARSGVPERGVLRLEPLRMSLAARLRDTF
jgi:hypothetical protein